MKFLPHQIKKAEQALTLLRENLVVYIQGKPRSGKTATSLKVAEDSLINSWLILCPKNAIPGWNKFLSDEELGLTKQYTIMNYEQVYKKSGKKYTLRHNPEDYQGTILDEAHNYGALGKLKLRQKLTKLMCNKNPLILLSGTAIVESPCGIYHQCYISKWSPFAKYRNFYKFHKVWGEPYYIKVMGRDINQYDKAKPELLDKINEFTVYMTQEDAGINIQVEDKLHYIELDKETVTKYNIIVQNKVLEIDDYTLVCDSEMKERTSLHMLESGVLKIDDEYIYLGNTEKIDYILKEFGDVKGLGIMCHFIGERNLLQEKFKKAKIYSSTSHAAGVDLSHLKYFVIISSGYSGAKFIQRRERITNINGSNTTTVHHILVKGGISEKVYKRVSKKLDFNNSCYERSLLG